MADLARRSNAPELMDGPCDYDTFRACLADLGKVNRLTLAYGPTIGFFERLRREGRLPPDRPLEVVDVGSGYGDTLRLVRRWADRRGVPVRLTGVDLNPYSKAAAEAATPGGVAFVTADAFAYEPERPADVVLSALFTHHLADADIVRFLAWMDASAGVGWFVNDLHRLAFPYYGFAALSRLMRWHPFVQHDGPVSIARSFRPADWRAYLHSAGVRGADVRRRFPFRLCVAKVQP